MPKTLVKVDLTKSAYDNDMVHNRWHPDVPMVAKVKPGEDFILETYDWTGGYIKNDDSADDVRDVDLSTVHFLSGPIEVEGAEPGDLLVVDLLDIGPDEGQPLGLQRLLLEDERRRLSDRALSARAEVDLGHSPASTPHSRHIPGVQFAGLIHPGLIGCLPDQKMLDTWNKREAESYRDQSDPRAAARQSAFRQDGACGPARRATSRRRSPPKARAPFLRASMAATAISRTSRADRGFTSPSTSRAPASRWATFTSARATARSPSAAPSKWRAGCISASNLIKDGVAKYGDQEPDLPAHRRSRRTTRTILIFEGISVDEHGRAALSRRPCRLSAGLPQRDRISEEVRLFGRAGLFDPRHRAGAGPHQRRRRYSRTPARRCTCRPRSSISTSCRPPPGRSSTSPAASTCRCRGISDGGNGARAFRRARLSLLWRLHAHL